LNIEMQIIREVNEQAELFYDKAQKLGTLAADAMGTGRRSQMTGLENIVETTLKTSDVYDYIKKQMARFDDWRDTPKKRHGQPPEEQKSKGFGESLLEQLEALKRTRDTICEHLGIPNQIDEHRRMRQHIFLQLIRQFIRQVVIEYEYRVSPMGQRR
jgi:hypothetical protein